MSSVDNKFLHIIRFSALVNTSLIYLDYIFEDMVFLYLDNLKDKYNYDSLSKSHRSRIDKLLKKEEKGYRNNLESLRTKLLKFSSIFEEDKKYGFVFDNMVDSLHETLVNTEFTIKDDFRKLYLDKLSKIKVKERSESELTRLSALLDNFITMNVNR